MGDWPGEVIDLYRTLGEPPPTAHELEGSLAACLGGRCVVAYNGPLIRQALAGLEPTAVATYVEYIAWHEYGHALSVARATDDQRRDGPNLLRILPPGIRAAIDYPGSYLRRQVFDEVIANIYPLMLGRAVGTHDYGRPDFLHQDVYNAFVSVIPWPPAP